MSILINKNSNIIVQGITGQAGSFHSKHMLDYGTKIIAGITPFKGGQYFDGIPIYNTILESKKYNKIDATIIFVPCNLAYDAILEAIENEIELIVCITEGISILDMIKIKNILKSSKSKLIGPNCPGIITPGECKLGIMPSDIHLAGNVGIVSRSGTLTYEAVYQLTNLNIGQSTCIGIGGDPILGMNFIDIVKEFNNDKDTNSIVLIGEIGGDKEEEVAEFIKNNVSKPVIGFIAGISAPENKKMGHAGAIMNSSKGSAKDKIRIFRECGIVVVENPSEIGITLKKKLFN